MIRQLIVLIIFVGIIWYTLVLFEESDLKIWSTISGLYETHGTVHPMGKKIR